ncbi:hypothetical protein ACM7OU_18760 [Pseudomonas aeruginosa]
MNIYPLGHESARLMSEAGYAVDVISKLILEDQCRKSDRDREGYLSDYDLGGLLAALTVAGNSLQECEVGAPSPAPDRREMESAS